MKKRNFKLTASILTVVMSLTMFAPTLALAKPHRDGGHRPSIHDNRGPGRGHDRDFDRPHGGGHHRHRNSYLWGLGLGFIGGAILHKNTNRPVVTQVAIYDYAMYKQDFINQLDSDELALYLYLCDLVPNAEGKSYKHYCERSVTQRRLEKITRALYEDYKFIRVSGDYIYFQKLR